MERGRILAVDDHAVLREGIKRALEHRYEVTTTGSPEEARDLLDENDFAAVLLDYHLGDDIPNGLHVAKWFRESHPSIAIIILTAAPELLYERDPVSIDDILDKASDSEAIIGAIENALWKRRLPSNIRKRRSKALFSFRQEKEAVRFISRTGGDHTERLSLETAVDNQNLITTVYSVPEIEKRNVICLASSIGCVGRCTFCESKNRSFVRPLSASELVGQAVYGLSGYHARQAFEEKSDTVINFATEGDCVYSNLANSCEAVKRLRAIKGLDLSFIMTTIGHERNLRRFLEEYSDLPIEFYWSVITTNRDTRNWLMPTAARQSLEGLRDVFQEIAKKTGKKVTASFSIIDGLNNRPEDVEAIARLLAGRPFRLKFMALRPGSLGDYKGPTPESLEKFSDEVAQKTGLECRVRRIVGGKVGGGCGEAVSCDNPHLKDLFG